jgi:hypothetical protein
MFTPQHLYNVTGFELKFVIFLSAIRTQDAIKSVNT